MTQYYDEMIKEGDKYAIFIQDLHQLKGINMHFFQSKILQYEVGENNLNIEIKLDRNYKKTGNLFIEIKEKTNFNNENWISSGIYRKDNSKEYLIGDYDNYWKFSINILRTMYESKKYKEVESETKTSIGFLLPIKVANSVAVTWSKKDDHLFRKAE
tara:strand:- start:56 stop:526 length:471 start_codon:yes stop_codon:yes gene_type:complete